MHYLQQLNDNVIEIVEFMDLNQKIKLLKNRDYDDEDLANMSEIEIDEIISSVIYWERFFNEKGGCDD